MTDCRETELRFLVPAGASVALAAEVTRARAARAGGRVVIFQLDSQGGHIARAGLGWHLRREGRRWIQSLTQPGRHAHEQLEHAVMRSDATWDAEAHAGSAGFARLQAALRDADEGRDAIGVCCRTEVRRTTRRVRGRAATVDIRFDDGWRTTESARGRVRALSFGLVAGAATAMAAMAERWCVRFGLLYEPRSGREPGACLGRGISAPLRKAEPACYDRGACVQAAFGAVLDECLSQVTRNALGLREGDPALRVEQVHQLRVGIRRLRSALRSFDGWVPAPSARLVDALRSLFARLGQARDQDVMAGGVFSALASAGAPVLALPAPAADVDPVALVRSSEVQRLFLGWVGWRLALLDVPPAASASAATASCASAERPVDFPREATARLHKWHRRIVAEGKRFNALDEAAMHALRKRIKRQRYAVEFFAPMLRRREVARYLDRLARVQAQMGLLNDLFVARASYQAQVDAQPAAWFALGWLAARIAEQRAAAVPHLRRLAEAAPPRARHAG